MNDLVNATSERVVAAERRMDGIENEVRILLSLFAIEPLKADQVSIHHPLLFLNTHV